MKVFRFLSRQLLALITAVISGLLTGQLLSTLPGFIFDQLGSSFGNKYHLWIQDAFWLVPFLVSFCVSILITLVVGKRARRVYG